MPDTNKAMLVRFLYKKILLNMTDEDAGRWLKAMLIYATEHSEPEPGELGERAQLLFDMAAPQYDEDREKYAETCRRNRENVSKRWKKQ